MSFQTDIKRFNQMYKLDCNEFPTIDISVPLIKRLHDFKKILLEEINEIDDIIWKADKLDGPEDVVNLLTSLADFLGDVQIYCASEMRKFGLPNDDILKIIMLSNFSKLGLDGEPIYDDYGKVQKGPLYYKPEPRIKDLIERLRINHY